MFNIYNGMLMKIFSSMFYVFIYWWLVYPVIKDLFNHRRNLEDNLDNELLILDNELLIFLKQSFIEIQNILKKQK